MTDRRTVQPESSAAELRLAIETAKDLGDGYEAAVAESLAARLGDAIDDRVARTFDDYVAERVDEPGPLRRVLARERRASLILAFGSMILGTGATSLVTGSTSVLYIWGAIAAINIVPHVRRS